MDEPSRIHQDQPVVVYDDDCRMCVTAKRGLERAGADSTVRFVPYRSREAADRLGPRYRPGRPDAAYLVEADGTVRPGLAAFLPLLPGLPGGRVLQWMLRVPLVRSVAEGAYRVVARNRYRWFGTVEGDAAEGGGDRRGSP